MTNKLVKNRDAPSDFTSGAYSLPLDGDLQATVTILGGGTNVTVGLTYGSAPLQYGAILHGIEASAGKPVIIVENGDATHTLDSVVYGAADLVVTITRVGTRVVFVVNGVRYVSTYASDGASGRQLMALLYAPGDGVTDPTLLTYVAPEEPAIIERMPFSDRYGYEAAYYAALASQLKVTGQVSATLEWLASYTDYLVLLSGVGAVLNLDAELHNTLKVTDSASSSSDLLLQYATNLVTGAVGRYNGFDFEGYASIGQQAFGWNSAGVYRIEGGTDDGAPITALVEFAAEALALSAKTRLVALFLGLSTDGQVFLRLTDDTDREVLYRAKRQQSLYRTNPYKGLSSRHWRLRLEVVDATELDLDSVEWVAGSTNRRTTT